MFPRFDFLKTALLSRARTQSSQAMSARASSPKASGVPFSSDSFQRSSPSAARFSFSGASQQAPAQRFTADGAERAILQFESRVRDASERDREKLLHPITGNTLTDLEIGEIVGSSPGPAPQFEDGPRSQRLDYMAGLNDEDFAELVAEGSISEGHRFVPGGGLVWSEHSDEAHDRQSLERLGFGAETAPFRETRYFNIEPSPGDGVVTMDFWIAEDQSGEFLSGDGRGYVDPMAGELGFDDSRMTVILDRETGRGMITLSPTTIRVDDPIGTIESFATESIFQSGAQFHDLLTVPARPIVLGPNPGLTSGVHDNYFQVDSSADSISIDYDSVNSVTAPIHLISVDGELDLERNGDGLLELASSTDLDAYPSVAIVQYLPDGTRNDIYAQENEPVVPGAL